MPCKYCGEQDESKLIISSRLVNGTVETIDICFRCFWFEKFEGKWNAQKIRTQHKIIIEQEEDLLKLQKKLQEKCNSFVFSKTSV